MSSRQRKREQFAQQCDKYFGPNRFSQELRSTNRRVDKEKDFKGEPRSDGAWRWMKEEKRDE